MKFKIYDYIKWYDEQEKITLYGQIIDIYDDGYDIKWQDLSEPIHKPFEHLDDILEYDEVEMRERTIKNILRGEV